jgi:acyl carrier protein
MSEFFPQGIEVLVRKAAVDPAFKTELLERRAGAARDIDLELTRAEGALLGAVPAAQLEAIIRRTTVPLEHRRAFLGRAAGAMLAALAVMGSGRAAEPPPPAVMVAGIIAPPPQRKLPPTTPEEMEKRVLDYVGKEFKTDKITRQTAFAKDLGATPEKMANFLKDLQADCLLKIPEEDFKKLETVGQVIERMQEELKKKQAADALNNNAVSRGLRPDVPVPAPVQLGIRPN